MKHHVVHEVRQVEQDRVTGIACPVRVVPHQALIICVIRQIGARLPHELVPRAELAGPQFGIGQHVVFRRIATEVESGEMLIDPFVQVVEPPIEAVEIQVDQTAMT